MSLGEKIRKLRKQNSLTLIQLGEKIGKSFSFLSDVERGRVMPSMATVFDLCNVFNVDASEFLMGLTPAKIKGKGKNVQ